MLKRIVNVDFGLIKTYNDSKVKTTSGFIEKLFGCSIAKVTSKIHSNGISNGTSVEKLISEAIKNTVECVYEIKTRLCYNELMDKFNSCRINDETFAISDGVYLIYKNVFEDIKHNNRKIQPDLLSIIVKNGRITFYVIEEKTGDNFDTKKSSAEKEHLTIFVEQLKQLNVVSGIDIKYFIVPFFSEKSKDKLSKSGFKGHFTEDEILKRNELSEVFGIDFDDIVKLFDKVRDINKKMVIDDMCGCSDIRSILSENPYLKNDVINLMCNNPQSVDPQMRRKIIEAFISLEQSI